MSDKYKILHRVSDVSCILAFYKIVNISILKKDISFFESHLEQSVLLNAELFYDENRIKLIEKQKGLYSLTCNDQSLDYDIKVEIKKNKLESATCNCDTKKICVHIGAALFFLRKIISEKALKKTKSNRVKLTSNREFVNKIDPEEIKNFLIGRMSDDKDTKALVFARFIVELEGVEFFETYLNRTFPPVMTAKITPAHREIRLFAMVIDEMRDQVKDLIGQDNYVDAVLIMIPLIKKSFYFKNRFVDVPEKFLKTHFKSIQILKAIFDVLEAPQLKTQITKDILLLLSYSYVTVTHIEEKAIILSQLMTLENRKFVSSIISESGTDKSNKSFKAFLEALQYICSTDQTEHDIKTRSMLFAEMSQWVSIDNRFIDHLLTMASEHDLPVRNIEALLYLKIDDKAQKVKLRKIAFSALSKYSNLSFFNWLYDNCKEEWTANRDKTLQILNNKKKVDTIINIYIREEKADELFDYIQQLSDISIYNKYLKELLSISYPNTEVTYNQWFSTYLQEHFGEASQDFLLNNLNFIGSKSMPLKKSIQKTIKSKFSKRRSLKS